MADPVSIPLDDGASLSAALALPGGDGQHPAVIVLHEALGLNDDIRRIADRFASEGYVAIAPDLYSHGNRALCLTRVLVAGMTGAGVDAPVRDIDAVRRWVEARDDVVAGSVAIAGFCMGGGFALLMAARGGLRAASVAYGRVPKQRDALTSVCPVVASYGGRDRIYAAHGRRLTEHLGTLGIDHDVKAYEGVGHSFMNKDAGPAVLTKIPSPLHVGYSEAEAEDAWARILAFFGKHVGP